MTWDIWLELGGPDPDDLTMLAFWGLLSWRVVALFRRPGWWPA